MFPTTCCGARRSVFATLTRAAAKSAGAKLRGAGALPTAVDWSARASNCERCPLRVVQRGTSYCGRPFLQNVNRDPVTDGCGCPTHAKAKDPAEHCPIDSRYRAAVQSKGECNCRWCVSTVTKRS